MDASELQWEVNVYVDLQVIIVVTTDESCQRLALQIILFEMAYFGKYLRSVISTQQVWISDMFKLTHYLC